MVLWFGDKPFGPMCNELAHVITPIGQLCLWCVEEIEAGDSGLIVPHLAPLGTILQAHHQECFLRETLGSVGHIEGRCSCYISGSIAGDPLGMTVRNAARAAVQAWLRTLRVH